MSQTIRRMNLNLNLKDFLKYLLRFKWLLITVPLVCGIITYFFLKEMPRQYKSESLISTGLISQFQDAALKVEQNTDYFKLSQQFGNLMELMRSKKRLTELSYKLVIHDLSDPDNSFREYEGAAEKLSDQERKAAIQEYQSRLSSNALISIADNGNIKLFDILRSFKYDDKSLSENLEVYRHGESDFIKVVFTSENSALSVFVVNNLSQDFIQYYTSLVTTGNQRSIATLDTILREKQNEAAQKNAQLLNSSASAASSAASAAVSQQNTDFINQQISEAESQKLAVIRNISSIKGSIKEIEDKLRGAGGYVNQNASTRDNSDIINIDNLIAAANRKYVNNNFRPQDKATVDSLQNIKNRLIAKSAVRTSGTSSAAIRQNLVDSKIKLESDLAAANSTLGVIEQQLATLGPRRQAGGYSAGVTNGGSALQAAQARDAEMASKEYEDALNQYEQTSLLAKAGIQLKIAEPGLPQPAEPSNKVLYLGLSMASSFMICLLTLLLVFMLNTSVNTPSQLEASTGQKVLGSLNLITEEDRDLRNIWDTNSVPNYSIYKDLLRSLRFELNEQLSDESNVLGITSITSGEGKSFLAGSISYAFAMMGKNVLLICENHDGLTSLVTNKPKQKNQQEAQVFESFLVKKEIQVEDRITILNRNHTSNSLLELKDVNSLVAGFKILKEKFDVVIIDIDSSMELHNVKEWLMFTDKSIAVFEAGNKWASSNLKFVEYLSSQKGFLGWVLNKVKVIQNT